MFVTRNPAGGIYLYAVYVPDYLHNIEEFWILEAHQAGLLSRWLPKPTDLSRGLSFACRTPGWPVCLATCPVWVYSLRVCSSLGWPGCQALTSHPCAGSPRLPSPQLPSSLAPRGRRGPCHLMVSAVCGPVWALWEFGGWGSCPPEEGRALFRLSLC